MLGILLTAFKKRRSLEIKIKKIQDGDVHLRNELIRDFQPFIAKTASSVCKRYISESDDEFSIGLIAFNEAINKYSPAKGSSLLAFAETLIVRQIIDYIRIQKKGVEVFPEAAFIKDDQTAPALEEERSLEEYIIMQESQKRREEIEVYSQKLSEYGIAFSDLPGHSPKHEDARRNAVNAARILVENEEMKRTLFDKKKLPVKRLLQEVPQSRKTIERNRKYIIAIALILHGSEFIYLREYILKGDK